MYVFDNVNLCLFSQLFRLYVCTFSYPSFLISISLHYTNQRFIFAIDFDDVILCIFSIFFCLYVFTFSCPLLISILLYNTKRRFIFAIEFDGCYPMCIFHNSSVYIYAHSHIPHSSSQFHCTTKDIFLPLNLMMSISVHFHISSISCKHNFISLIPQVNLIVQHKACSAFSIVFDGFCQILPSFV